MKQIFAIIAALALIFTLSGCKNEEKDVPKNYVNPPFFIVKDEKTGGVAYLLGSMHVGLPNTVYPDAVYSSLDECETVACEIDLIELEKKRDEVNEAMKVLECKSARELIGDNYDEIKKYFTEHGINANQLENYIPAMWSIMLSQKASTDAGYSSKYGTDREILALAKQKGKKIVELETAEEQYIINANQSRELQVYSLKNAVSVPYEQLMAQSGALYLAWSTNNSTLIETMLSGGRIPDEIAEDYEKYYSEMYEKRQEKMAEYVVKSLKNGEKVFVVVGAAHYFAAPDILDFIEKSGYSVEKFYYENAA